MKSSTKKTILISVIALFLLASTAIALHSFGVIDIPLLPDKKNALEESEINYGPPTEEEKESTEQFKEGLGNQNSEQGSSAGQSATQKKSVTPYISSWGQPNNQNVEVSGYVPGVYEEGGTCTLTMEKAGQTVSASKTATLSAQNVSCGFISVERSQLNPGKWQLKLSYSSATSEGTSSAIELEVK